MPGRAAPRRRYTSGLSEVTRLISRGWRILGTAIGFAFVGSVSLGMALFAFPLIRLIPGTRKQSELRCQYALHLVFRVFVGLISVFGVMRLRGDDMRALREPGTLVVANHPTLIDALVLMSFMPQADCVVKGSYCDNFFLSGAVEGAGYIPNRNGPQLVEECAERLRQGRTVLIFPEGTRSPKGELGPFARGAAHIAIRAGCEPLPVTIECDPATLYRGLSWWDVPERRFEITLTVGQPIPIDTAVSQSPSRSRAARSITDLLRDHFQRRLAVVRNDRAA